MRTRGMLLLIVATVLVFAGGCKRLSIEPTPTISGLAIITPTHAPSSTPTTQIEYPPPADIPQAIQTQPILYPVPQPTPLPSLQPTAYPAPGSTTLTPLAPTTTSQATLPDAAPSTSPQAATATQITPVATATSSLPSATPVPSITLAYPLPENTATSPSAVSTPTSLSYPGAEPNSTPLPIVSVTSTSAGAYPGPGGITPTLPLIPSLTPTPTVSGTPPAIPEEIPPVPAVTPPPSGSLVRIWYAWSPEQARLLDEIVDAFQDTYPGIRFELTNIPQSDLRRRYETAAYNGGGPGLLLAPADWGPAYYETGLVKDLSPYTSAEFLAQINPAALGTALYTGALISLPISQQGVVLYRNCDLIASPAETFDELIAAARSATRAGNLGAYFDRGAFFSVGNLGGLGGALMDSAQYPQFNSPAGFAWLDLMEAYDVAGAVGLNTNRDLELFQSGRIGYIIEGTWQIDSLVAALGEEVLVIDPWPAFGTGHLSGFVQADSVFLNPNTRPGDSYAAMLFMGYLLTPDVQQYLAEVGMIPVTLDADPRPVYIAQAAEALAGGTAYPPVANPRVLTAYWEAMELAIREVFTRQVAPQAALQHADEYVRNRLSELIP